MTLIETDELAHALDGINGEGVCSSGAQRVSRGWWSVVVTPDAQVVSSAEQIAFLRDGRRVDDTRCSSGSGSLLAGGHP